MRLATFNILHGKSLTDGRVDSERFAAAVGHLDADVLALQEVDCGQPRSHGADLTAVAAAAMGAREYRFVSTMAGVPGSWSAATGDHPPTESSYGISLLSRFPVRQWRTLRLPTLRVRVPLVGVRRRPSLVRDEPRAAVVAVLETPDGPLTVVTTHLTLIPGWNAFQLARVLAGSRDLPGPRIVLGDLNLAGAFPARASRMRPLVTAMTFPVGRPVRQIDHILGAGAVRVTSAGSSLDLGVSDHRALTVEVELGAADAVSADRDRR
ncbi:endonuclease/exonuclease/phosphatase family protein [Pengzhenrongella sicca]|uniref:Endonuclease/exonuclease/phosphatase family protein n=1 Tax=Pengzhenrongella sicca TaxID=2819238 RepID=A0A8A4ZGU9_9MICO|nr:endonuclease/exonuclease/phosphatase family protein [Pengzhenrongella sicca]QTE29756.1 endonuclease/exonuclease/phosphatase family protein [Pengzhenrongella sicca]